MIYYFKIDNYLFLENIFNYSNYVESVRKEKYNSYYNKEDKINCILSSLIINKYCKDNNIINFNMGLDSNNKPYDINHNFYFNISHADNMVVVVFDNNDVGIDVEKIDSYTIAQLNYTLNEEDQKVYNVDNDLFTKIWTIKESYVKQSGNGLLDTFNNLKFNYLKNHNTILDLYINSFNLGTHYISVCSKNNIVDVNKLTIEDIFI